MRARVSSGGVVAALAALVSCGGSSGPVPEPSPRTASPIISPSPARSVGADSVTPLVSDDELFAARRAASAGLGRLIFVACPRKPTHACDDEAHAPEILSIGADGRNEVRLTHDNLYETAVVADATRRYLVMSVNGEGPTQDPHVLVMRTDGSGQRLVGEAPYGSWLPTDWSVAGHGVLAEFEGSLSTNVSVIDPDTGRVTAVTRYGSESDRYATDPQWIDGGQRIVYREPFALIIATPDGSTRSQIFGSGHRDRYRREVSELAVSPDQQHLAVISQPLRCRPNGCRGTGPEQIIVLDPRGRDRRIVATGSFEGLAWSPDSRRLAFTAFDEIAPTVGTVRYDGHDLRYLAHGGGPVWSPDNRTVAFFASLNTSPLDDRKAIYSVRIDGTQPHLIRPARDMLSLQLWLHA